MTEPAHPPSHPHDAADAGPATTHPRFQRWLRSIKAFNEILESGAKIGLIIAGIVAAVQYVQSIKSEKIGRVLAYSERFDSDALLDAQRHLFHLRVQANADQEGQPLAAVVRSEQQLIQRMRGTDAATDETAIAPGEGDPGSDMALIVGFMDTIRACRQGGLCDEDTVDNFFAETARALAVGFRCHILDERKRRPGYATGLLEIAGMVDDAGMADPSSHDPRGDGVRRCGTANAADG